MAAVATYESFRGLETAAGALLTASAHTGVQALILGDG